MPIAAAPDTDAASLGRLRIDSDPGDSRIGYQDDHVLGPAGHAVTGTVHRVAEPETGFVEASRIPANGAMVTEVFYDTDDELPWQEDGPEPDAVRTAVDTAAARSPSRSSAVTGTRRSLWDRLLGR